MRKSVFKLVFILLGYAGIALAQQPVNNAQVAGTATSTGNGTSGAGTQRVNIASDNTAFQIKVLGNGGATLDVAQGGGTAATNAIQEAGVFNTTLPTLTNGQGGAIQVDAKAQQLVDLNYVAGSAIATGNGTNGGAIRVAVASDNTAFAVNATLQTGSNTVGKVDVLGNAGAIIDFAGQNASSPANAFLIGGQFNTSPTTITSGNASPLQLDSNGKLLVNCTGCSAGSTVSLNPATSGGLTLSHTVTAGSTNATSLKASAGQIYEACFNSNAAYPIFLKFYNKASAPTVGTDTPVKILEAQAGVPACMRTEEGFTFGTGIAWAATKGIADSDATAVLASDGSVEIAYK
jgi:hypothetical protein